MISGSPSELRRQNRDIVLRHIVEHGALSRTQLARMTGLTGAAVSRITRELIEVGLLREGAPIALKGQVGRRNVRLELHGAGAYVMGIALTANARSVSIADCRGEIVARADVGPIDLDNPQAALERVAQVARRLIRRKRVDASRLLGCGVSVAGRTNPETGELIHSEPLGWSALPLGRMLRDLLGLPVRVEGRALALLLAELWRGRAVGKDNVVLINNGVWIGGGLAIDGHIARGQSNLVGQVAHLSLGHSEAPCVCGRMGCLDAVASGAAIVRRLRDVALPGHASDQGARLYALSEHAGPEHPEIAQAFHEAGREMGRAVDVIFSILDPELVLLAGAAGRQPDYLAGVHAALGELRGAGEALPVEASQVTSDESAVWLALEAFVYSRALDIEQLKVA